MVYMVWYRGENHLMPATVQREGWQWRCMVCQACIVYLPWPGGSSNDQARVNEVNKLVLAHEHGGVQLALTYVSWSAWA